jgi:putative FmdB family regulatory protein
MPIYEYECMNCGQHFEVMQKFSDEPLSTCTACSGPLHKLISHTSFVLKGSGWYVTDYASPERKKKQKETEAQKKTVKSKGENNTGSKAEMRTETAAKP